MTPTAKTALAETLHNRKIEPEVAKATFLIAEIQTERPNRLKMER
jgi:hypothetical protein